MMRTPKFLVMLTILSLASLPVSSEDQPDIQPPADARWRAILKDQVKTAKNCDLSEVLTYSELKIGDETAISGKISCVDGRQYDYSRPRPHQNFEFRLCEPSVC